MDQKNLNPGLPGWLEKYNPIPLVWNGCRVFFAVVPVSKIKMNKGQIDGLPANPRQWTKDEAEALKKSVVETPELTVARGVLAYPFGDELVVLGGNMRRQTAGMEPKEKALPCYIYPEDTPTSKLMEIVIKDNGTFGAWDTDSLANEWNVPLKAWGVPDWVTGGSEGEGAGGSGGSGEGGKNKDHQCQNQEDNTDGMTVEKRAAKGSIFKLGQHVLMCGDATDKADVEAVLKVAGVLQADLALTDPPYGISIVQPRENNRAGVGGGLICAARNYAEVIGDESTDTARVSCRILEDCAKERVIFGGNYFTDFLPPSQCWVVWDKVNGETDFSDVELAWCSLDKGARLFRHTWNGMVREGDRQAEGITRLHPTQKPVGLLTAIVEKFFPAVETILDPFGGSGSTLIAAERLGKRCLMLELSPEYVDVILARWERFSGKKAELYAAVTKVPEIEK